MASEVIDEKGWFNKEAALEKYKKFLLSVPEENRMYLTYYADNTEFLQDLNAEYTIGYSPRRDAIVYNDSIDDFWGYNMEEVITHELAHRADCLLFHSTKDRLFSKAIIDAEKVLRKSDQLEAILAKYTAEMKNYCLSDIFSALLGEWHNLLPAGHSDKYWSIPGNREKEIFAELFTLQSLNNHSALRVIENEFPEVYSVYLKIIKGVTI